MELTQQHIETLLQRLSRELRNEAPLRTLLVGGTIMVHAGWRGSTKDVDISFEADDPLIVAEAEEAVARLRRRLNWSIEIVSPALFLPVPAGWQDRCRFIKRVGQVEVFYFDLVSTALAKIARSNFTDQQDVIKLVELGEITLNQLDQAVEQLLGVLEADPGRYFTQPGNLRENYAKLRPRLDEATQP